MKKYSKIIVPELQLFISKNKEKKNYKKLSSEEKKTLDKDNLKRDKK